MSRGTRLLYAGYFSSRKYQRSSSSIPENERWYFLEEKLGAILEIYEMFVGDDPRHMPMRIFPGVHYSMGGLWVDFEQRTNISGLLAAGECDYSIHGANRLGANSLVSCVYGGFIAAPAAINWAQGVERNGKNGSALCEQETRRQQ